MTELENLSRVLDARTSLLPGPEDHAAIRLFNGFLEGSPGTVLELFGRTLVFHDHKKRSEVSVQRWVEVIQARIPWVSCVLWKRHTSKDREEQQGKIILGDVLQMDTWIQEDKVKYAIDLRLNMDTSFYLDTRVVRAWLWANAASKKVLNTFAYTGSLGVAALAGGASRVIQLDRNKMFLEVAKRSYELNGLAVAKGSMVAADFFEHIGRLKKQEELFDIIVVDPPFFSRTKRGQIDLEGEAHRVINKVRPLVGDGGALVTINNALYLEGAAYHAMLSDLCKSGYMKIETLLEVLPDCAGFSSTRSGKPPAAPAPFNHPTKIAILRVKRKDGRRAGDPPPKANTD